MENHTLNTQILTFITETGLKIVGQAYGNANNPPVLLLHGVGQTRHSWGDTAEILAERGFYAIALDARGHGESDWSRDGVYTLETYAHDLKTVVHSLTQKPIIVGASMGGFTALAFEGESTENLVKALILVDIAPAPKEDGIKRIFDFMQAYVDSGFDSIEAAAEAVAQYLPHRSKPEAAERLRHNLRQKEDGKFYWHWDPALLNNFVRVEKHANQENTQRILKAAKNLKVPTLVIRGEKSDLVSEQAVKMFEAVSDNITSVVVKGAHHMVAGDSNNEFTQEVLKFIDNLS